MGFHTCEYCPTPQPTEHVFGNTSSGDTVIHFDNGLSFQVPDMLPHYIEDHSYDPPAHFMEAVGWYEVVARPFNREGGPCKPVERIGYLSGPDFPTKIRSSDHTMDLLRAMRVARSFGNRVQTRGIRG